MFLLISYVPSFSLLCAVESHDQLVPPLQIINQSNLYLRFLPSVSSMYCLVQENMSFHYILKIKADRFKARVTESVGDNGIIEIELATQFLPLEVNPCFMIKICVRHLPFEFL